MPALNVVYASTVSILNLWSLVNEVQEQIFLQFQIISENQKRSAHQMI